MKYMIFAKRLSIYTSILVYMMLSLTYLQFADYRSVQNDYTLYKEAKVKELTLFMNSALNIEKESAFEQLESLSNSIQNDIREVYTNDEELKYDIENPSSTSRLSMIFDNWLEPVYVNTDNYDNKIFVITKNNVLWNKSNSNTSHKTATYALLNYINANVNPTLARHTMDSILNNNLNKEDFFIWQEIYSNSEPIVSIEDAAQLILKDDEEALKCYNILIPSYITKDGDIFGIDDIDSLGMDNKNYKIILIQSINLYDVISKYDSFTRYNIDSYNQMEKIHCDKLQYKLNNVICSIAFMLVIIIGSGKLQNKIRMISMTRQNK